ncbi:hypothetical protein RJ639_045019 [Escallonia herrerae]|uniref:YLP motif-containing protein 1 n=1 Tax=Escallonia herrerae TaxID=1293975 RepID=A0AA89B0C9_9ASTE|nr:hypothetical protein RJ639_045019 [Escallonia herrerae]
MDYSWRPPPPPFQGNTCPTCSISHFPFCPPLHQNPSFRFHPDQFRPPYDPFLDHPGPAATALHRPFAGKFGDQLPWHRNPSLETDPYGRFHEPQYRDPVMGNRGNELVYSTDAYGFTGFDKGSVGIKRMRVDDRDSYGNSLGVSVDHERRLKLIRDHGSLPQATVGSGMGFNCEIDGYHENSVVNRSLERGDYNELRSRDMAVKSRCGFEVNEIGNVERKGSHGLAFGHQYVHGDRTEELGKSNYGHGKSSWPSSQPVGRFANSEQAQQRWHEEAPHHEGRTLYNSHAGEKSVHSARYSFSEAPNENYEGLTPQQPHPFESVSQHEPHYSRPDNLQGMSGSKGPYYDRDLDDQLAQPYRMHHSMPVDHDFLSPGQMREVRQSFGVNVPSRDAFEGSFGHQKFPVQSPYGLKSFSEERGYPISPDMNVGPIQAHVTNFQPPLPASPPPPLPLDPPGQPYVDPFASSSPSKTTSSLFPIVVSSSVDVPSSYVPVPEVQSSKQTYFTNRPHMHASNGFSTEEFQASQGMSRQYSGENQSFSSRHLSIDKPKVVDAFHLFKPPHRATRPDHMVIILRGLPGSGKSYLAKMLRDLEVENGGDAPRIHSMDDYFMTEVEKEVEESEVPKSSGSARVKKRTMKVMEYCYEPEMEEAYRSSMFKAFKKTIDDGVFSFIIVDDRNLRVADFAQFWAIAKRSGYEVYLLEATYKDPAGCAARNVHGFTQDDIQKMAAQWEDAPSLYVKLDPKALLHGDDLEDNGILEVDMDTDDLCGREEREPENVNGPPADDLSSDGPSEDDRVWHGKDGGGHPVEEVKELGRSKWSTDLDEDDTERTEGTKGNSSALSGLIQAYSKEGKSVRWGDQVGTTGFSIGAAKRANVLSIVIGPGAGYNLKSNPIPEEEKFKSSRNTGEFKRQNIFQEQIRAERESFRAVFDKRRHRVGLNAEE